MKVQDKKADVQTVLTHPKVHYSTAKPPYDQHGLNRVELSPEQRSCCIDELSPPYLSLDIPLLLLAITALVYIRLEVRVTNNVD